MAPTCFCFFADVSSCHFDNKIQLMLFGECFTLDLFSTHQMNTQFTQIVRLIFALNQGNLLRPLNFDLSKVSELNAADT